MGLPPGEAQGAVQAAAGEGGAGVCAGAVVETTLRLALAPGGACLASPAEQAQQPLAHGLTQHPACVRPPPQLLALIILIILLLAMPERPPPACPVADCVGVLGGKAGECTHGSCLRPRETPDARAFTPTSQSWTRAACATASTKTWAATVRACCLHLHSLKVPLCLTRVRACSPPQGVCFSGAVRDAFGGCCKASERGCNGQCFSSPCSCSAPQPAAQQCRPVPQQGAAPQQCGAGVQRSVVQGRQQAQTRWYSG